MLAAVFLLVLIVGGGFGYVALLRSNYPTEEDLAPLAEMRLEVETDLPGTEWARLVERRQPVVLRVHIDIAQISESHGLWPEWEEIEWSTSSGALEPLTPNHGLVEFTPAPGAATARVEVEYRGRFRRGIDSTLFGPVEIRKKAVVALVVPAPASELKDGVIDGYRMGEYIDPRNRAQLAEWGVTSGWPILYPERYTPPEFFYKVDETNRDLPISRSFRLGDYALDYPWFSLGMPQYISLDYNLIRKLEDLIDLMNADGFAIERFTVVYPFRSPYYNLTSIEEDGQETLKAPFSMHQYGKALDIVLDQDGDFVIDDLNQDGQINIHDPEVIMHYVNLLDRKYREKNDPRLGGAGLYTHTDFHERKQTPYIHFDVRGFTAPNGNLVRWPSRWPDGTPIRWGDI